MYRSLPESNEASMPGCHQRHQLDQSFRWTTWGPKHLWTTLETDVAPMGAPMGCASWPHLTLTLNAVIPMELQILLPLAYIAAWGFRITSTSLCVWLNNRQRPSSSPMIVVIGSRLAPAPWVVDCMFPRHQQPLVCCKACLGNTSGWQLSVSLTSCLRVANNHD